MPLDIRSAESAYAKGNAQFEMFKRKFLRNWNKPLAQLQVALIMGSHPDEIVSQVPPEKLERLGRNLDLDLIQEQEYGNTEVPQSHRVPGYQQEKNVLLPSV